MKVSIVLEYGSEPFVLLEDSDKAYPDYIIEAPEEFVQRFKAASTEFWKIQEELNDLIIDNLKGRHINDSSAP